MNRQREFTDRGIVVIPGALSQADLQLFDECMDRALRAHSVKPDARFAKGDFIVQLSDCWPLALNASLRNVAKQCIGDDVAWIQNADVHQNIDTTIHRDCVDRNSFGDGYDWNETRDPYRIVRIATYLTSTIDSGSSFLAAPGSHKDAKSGVMDTYATSRGDCIAFDPRILHGSTIIKTSKRAMFFCYGARNSHSFRHSDYYNKIRLDLGYRPIPPQLASMLAISGLDL